MCKGGQGVASHAAEWGLGKQALVTEGWRWLKMSCNAAWMREFLCNPSRPPQPPHHTYRKMVSAFRELP